MTSCEYPTCDGPAPVTQTSSTTLVRPEPKPHALPFTGGDVALITGIAVLVIIMGLMCLYGTKGWTWILDHFRP